jgi:uncharacterized protein DUF2846
MKRTNHAFVFFARLSLIAAVLGIAGCASTPQASRERDADAKEFATQPGASTLYIYRNDFSSLGQNSNLWVDGRLIGATLPRAYFRVNVRPGKHLLNGDGPDTGSLSLETRAGELYFVSLSMINGISYFARVKPEVGRETILACCALLENWAPGQRPLLR